MSEKYFVDKMFMQIDFFSRISIKILPFFFFYLSKVTIEFVEFLHTSHANFLFFIF